MKPAIYFETTKELDAHVSHHLIASVFNRCPDELYKSGAGTFSLNQKRKLEANGVTQEHWDMCKHLIPKAKHWSAGTLPVSTYMTTEEFGAWKMLKHIANVINS